MNCLSRTGASIAALALALSGVVADAWAQRPGAGARADVTEVTLHDSYSVVPGVTAIRTVFLHGPEPLSVNQCQAMGASSGADTSLAQDVDGVPGCALSWNMSPQESGFFTVEDSGIYQVATDSERLIEGFTTDESRAVLTAVTVIVYDATAEEYSPDAHVADLDSAASVTWLSPTGNVFVRGRLLDTSSQSASLSPAPSPSPSATSLPPERQSVAEVPLWARIVLYLFLGPVALFAIVGFSRKWLSTHRQAEQHVDASEEPQHHFLSEHVDQERSSAYSPTQSEDPRFPYGPPRP